MAEISNELIFESLKQIQSRLDRTDHKFDELKSEMGAMRGYMISVRHDMHNIYGVLGRLDGRPDRIERRLDIVDAPALT